MQNKKGADFSPLEKPANTGHANAYANSATLFGREYLAISDGKTGNDLPRQYDDTNFDRFSQSGPGASPTVVDENVIVAIAASPNGATESGFLVTITTTSVHGLAAGQSVTVASVGVAGYNGTFSITSVPDSAHFAFTATIGGLAASGGQFPGDSYSQSKTLF